MPPNRPHTKPGSGCAKRPGVPQAASRQSQRLAVDLQKATVQALRRSYDDLNATFFKSRLRRPVRQARIMVRSRGRLIGPLNMRPKG